MRTITLILIAFILTSIVTAQEDYNRQIQQLSDLKDKVTEQEKEALKSEVETINQKLANNELSAEQAKLLKESAAEKRALNIADRLAIIDNKITLLERNEGDVLRDEKDISIFDDGIGISINVGDEHWHIFDERKHRYDRRTYSDFVLGIGFNNAILDGESLNDSPYKAAGSRNFEIGWNWRTRVFQNTNFMRFNYGFSFQFNGLKPKGNQFFVIENGQTVLAESEVDLKKSKFRMDNLVFPLHFEFGPSRTKKSQNRMRYSIDRQFRLGMGGYGGLNMGSRQKLKYKRDGQNVKDKLIGGYNTSDFVYGLSGYVGIGGVLFHVKYDLNPIFRNAVVEQHNISFGLRFDL
ncbi:MAG: hypothetical protein E4H26_01920 [Flavobacteriales bacterium]|nr:MAG: hypothetical protein E4H26_01920 [Flavobacteriales bacterium]